MIRANAKALSMQEMALQVIGLQRRQSQHLVQALKVMFEPLVDNQKCPDGFPRVIVAPGDDRIYATLNFCSIFRHDGPPL